MKRNYDFSKGAVIKGSVKSKTQVEEALKNQQKVLTSIRIDKDVLEVAKKQASKEGVGYLTWLNKKLRQAVLNEDTILNQLKRRIKNIEKIVLK